MNKTLTPAQQLIVSVILATGYNLTADEVLRALAQSPADQQTKQEAYELWSKEAAR